MAVHSLFITLARSLCLCTTSANESTQELVFSKMTPSLPDSSLSPTVFNLFRCIEENSKNYSSYIYNNCIDDESSLLNWHALETALPTDANDHSHECYSSAICNLSPAFNRTSNEIKRICLNEHFINKFAWTQNTMLFETCIDLLNVNDTVLALQLMTSALERILGNVYLLKEKKVPSLLRELLFSPVLEEIFGTCPMRIIRILMGLPTSLNLRNLVWHGFLAPNELPEDCCWFLLAVIAALGEILKQKGIRIEDIPRRNFHTLPEIKDTFPMLNIARTMTRISSFKIIQESMLLCWKLSLTAFEKERYAHCVIRIFPLLENVLRRIFSTVNHCDERILTAESSVLFTTFDEILAHDVNGEENKFKNFVGDSFMLMLLDLLLLPNGLRLRDRLSHGEIDTNCITHQLANHILCISITACTLASKLFDDVESEDDFSIELLGYAKDYTSKFTPHVQCIHQINSLISSLNNWKIVLGNEKDAIEELCTYPGDDIFMSLQYCNQVLSLPQLSKLLSLDSNLEILQTKLSDSNLQLIHRPQTEIAIIMQVTRIAATSHCASLQIINSIEEQIRKKQQFQLRSRNRETFSRMLKAISNLAVGLRIVAIFLVVEYLNCQRSDSNNKTRLFRYLLRYADKLKALTNCQKNRWEESETLTTTFLTQLTNFQ